MLKLSEFINEALKPIKLSDVFDISRTTIQLAVPSCDIDSEKVMKSIKGPCSWDDIEVVLNPRYVGSYPKNYLYKPNGISGTLKDIGESGEDPDRTANMLRAIGRIEIKNPNSVRSIVSAITKEIKSISKTDGKETQVYSFSKNDDDTYTIAIDMKWDVWVNNLYLVLAKK